jgi:uncharacterized protein (TIGR03435 family)
MLTLAAPGWGQSFEVATVKRVDTPRPGEGKGGVPPYETTPGHLTMRNMNLTQILVWAYKISPLQITGLQDESRYDIQAKAAGPATTDEMRVMLQTLLADRFKMKSHREPKEMSAYALVEAKGGHKLTPSEAADGPGIIPTEGKQRIALDAKATTLDQLCMFLSMPLRTVVLDQTGLKGKFDFAFDITPYIPRDMQPGDPPPDPVSILQTALSKQLGLRLEAKKMPVDMLIIDHIEKVPVEN